MQDLSQNQLLRLSGVIKTNEHRLRRQGVAEGGAGGLVEKKKIGRRVVVMQRHDATQPTPAPGRQHHQRPLAGSFLLSPGKGPCDDPLIARAAGGGRALAIIGGDHVRRALRRQATIPREREARRRRTHGGDDDSPTQLAIHAAAAEESIVKQHAVDDPGHRVIVVLVAPTTTAGRRSAEAAAAHIGRGYTTTALTAAAATKQTPGSTSNRRLRLVPPLRRARRTAHPTPRLDEGAGHKVTSWRRAAATNYVASGKRADNTSVAHGKPRVAAAASWRQGAPLIFSSP